MTKKLLLVDDDSDELDIFTEALLEIQSPFKCTYISDPEYAMQVVDAIAPDYIFIDYNMPKLDGLKCLEALQKIKNVKNVPVILYSNYISEETKERAYKLGASSCIKKPASVKNLSKILKNILV